MFSLIFFSAFALTLRLALRSAPGAARRSRRLRAAALGGAALVSLGLEIPTLAVLGKVLGLLAMPVGLLWIGLWALSIELGARALDAGERSARRAALAACVAFVGFGAAGNTYLGGWLYRGLEARWVGADPMAGESFDALVVHGGGVRVDEGGQMYLTSAGDRAVLAARLYHAGLASHLVAQGALVPGHALPPSAGPARANARLWEQLGIPSEAIVIRDDQTWNTRREAQDVATLVASSDWERVGIISSAWHLSRVAAHYPDALVNAQGASVTLRFVPADVRGLPEWRGVVSVVPSGYGFVMVHKATWERFGRALGR